MSNEAFYEVACPHCQGAIIIYQNELNCRIFRHGAYTITMEPIHPHLNKEECDRLVLENRIVGCGKPFRVEGNSNENIVAIICDYI